MLAKMEAASKANLEKLDQIVFLSTQKLTHTMNMKLLLATDLSDMAPTFQKKAKEAIQKHFEDTVLLALGDQMKKKRYKLKWNF